MRNVRFGFLVVAGLLVACGSSVKGEYTDDSGMFTYNFKSGGKVEITTKVMGVTQTQETDYKVEDGKVKLGPKDGPQQVISIDKNGCLEAGGLQGNMCKKKS